MTHSRSIIAFVPMAFAAVILMVLLEPMSARAALPLAETQRPAVNTDADERHTNVAEDADPERAFVPRTAVAPKFPDLPDDFDPRRPRDGEDRGVWLIRRELTLGHFEDSDMPCADHAQLKHMARALGADAQSALKSLPESAVAELKALVQPIEQEIRNLKRSWGYEFLMAQLRVIEAGKDRQYPSRSPPKGSLRELAGPDNMVRILSGPVRGITRMVVVDPAEHPTFNTVHSRIMQLDQTRSRIVKDYLVHR